MESITILISDSDSAYIEPFELKFLETFGDYIDLEIITDITYLKEYFLSPREIEVLIISEALYTDDLKKHDIKKTILLSEEKSFNEDTSEICRIFKYSNPNDIFNQILSFSPDSIRKKIEKDKKTKMVMFFSAAGGVGKTTLALALSHALGSNGKKVLYVNAERINRFQYLLQNWEYIPTNFIGMFVDWNAEKFEYLQSSFGKGTFDFLPPFPAELSSMNLEFSLYRQIILTAKAKNLYDYIVVDTDHVFDMEKAQIIADADKVFLLLKDSKHAVYSTEQLMRNMSSNEKDKYYYICNAYHCDDKNKDEISSEKYRINEYVSYIPNAESYSITEIAENEDIQKLAYLIM